MARGAARVLQHAAGVLMLVLVGAVPLQGAAAEVPRLAVFDLELVDTSLQGEMQGADPAEAARLAATTELLRSLLAESGAFELVDTAPAAEAIAAAGRIRTCNGCESRIGRELGADLVLNGWVQKVSNLILNLNLVMRDAATRERVFAGSVDIRGNTDESWAHGVRYLVKNRILRE
jgi:hypothetical protein